MFQRPIIHLPNYFKEPDYVLRSNYQKVIEELVGTQEVRDLSCLNSRNREWYDLIKYRANLKLLANGVIEAEALSIGKMQGDKSHFVVVNSRDVVVLQGHLNYDSPEVKYTPQSVLVLAATDRGFLLSNLHVTPEQQAEALVFAYENRESDPNIIFDTLQAIPTTLFDPNYFQQPTYYYDGLTPF